jgi:hypothetical protein
LIRAKTTYGANIQHSIEPGQARNAPPENARPRLPPWGLGNDRGDGGLDQSDEQQRTRDRAGAKLYRDANAEKLRAQQKARRAANADKIRAREKAYRLANAEKLKARSAARYAAHAEEIKARARAYRIANAEKIKAWRAANRERLLAEQRLRHAARKGRQP